MPFTLLTNLLYSLFLATSFLTKLLNLAKSLGTGVNSSISNLSTSVLKLAKFVFDAKLLALHVSHFLNQFLLHNCLDLMSFPELLYGGKYWLIL